MIGYRSKGGNESRLAFHEYAIVGALTGVCSRAIVQPFDVIKIRFQLQIEPISARGNVDSAVQQYNARYTGVVQALRRIVAEEGVRSLWKGHFAAQCQAASFALAQFSAFEKFTEVYWRTLGGAGQLDSAVKEDGSVVKHSRALSDFLCGGLAGCTAAVVSQPFDVLRTRFIAQCEPKIYRSFADAAASMAKLEGFRGFFKGLTPSLLLIFPQIGFQFTFFNVAQNALVSVHAPAVFQTDVYRVNAFVSGAFAGVASKTLVYPFDLLKRRLQVQGFEQARAAFGKLHRSRGLLHSVSLITRDEGAAAFYKGLLPSLLKSACSTGLRFFVYDLLCTAVGRLKSDLRNRGA